MKTIRTYWFVEHKKEATDHYHPREIDEHGVMTVYVGQENAQAAMRAMAPAGEDPAAWGNLRVRNSTFSESDAIRIG